MILKAVSFKKCNVYPLKSSRKFEHAGNSTEYLNLDFIHHSLTEKEKVLFTLYLAYFVFVCFLYTSEKNVTFNIKLRNTFL